MISTLAIGTRGHLVPGGRRVSVGERRVVSGGFGYRTQLNAVVRNGFAATTRKQIRPMTVDAPTGMPTSALERRP